MRLRSRRHVLHYGLTLAGLGLAAGCASLPIPGLQTAKIPRVGFLAAGVDPKNGAEPFRKGLAELGYMEGKTIIVEYRDTGGKADLIPEITRELVEHQVDVLVVAPASAVRGAMQAAPNVPIVIAYGDPVALGLVTSLAHPGNNLTGLSAGTAEMSGRRLQILKEAVPSLSRAAVLWWKGGTDLYAKETESAAQSLGVQMLNVAINGPADFESALATITNEGAEALVVAPGPIFGADGGAMIAGFANKAKLPTVFEGRLYAENGGLIAYGPNLADLSRRSASYVEKIVKGAKPGDLPIQLPTTFDFVLNQKTALALGLAFPPSLVSQATEILQ